MINKVYTLTSWYMTVGALCSLSWVSTTSDGAQLAGAPDPLVLTSSSTAVDVAYSTGNLIALNLDGTSNNYDLDPNQPLVEYLRIKPKLHQPWRDLVAPNGILQDGDTLDSLGCAGPVEIMVGSNPVKWFLNQPVIKTLIDNTDDETRQASFARINRDTAESKEIQSTVLKLQEFRDLFKEVLGSSTVETSTKEILGALTSRFQECGSLIWFRIGQCFGVNGA